MNEFLKQFSKKSGLNEFLHYFCLKDLFFKGKNLTLGVHGGGLGASGDEKIRETFHFFEICRMLKELGQKLLWCTLWPRGQTLCPGLYIFWMIHVLCGNQQYV